MQVVSKLLPPKALTGVHLVETSQALRVVQDTKLKQNAASSYELLWYNAIAEIPRNPSVYTMLVAHEFFDALPVHIIQVWSSHFQTTVQPLRVSRKQKPVGMKSWWRNL